MEMAMAWRFAMTRFSKVLLFQTRSLRLISVIKARAVEPAQQGSLDRRFFCDRMILSDVLIILQVDGFS